MTGNAAIYISDPTLLGSILLDTFQEIRTYRGLEDKNNATGLFIELENVQIQMNFLPEERISAHLQGFEGFIHQACDDKDTLVYALSRLRNVRFVIGCVITPSLSLEATNFLFKFNARLNGLIFINNQVFDYTKIPLTKL